MDKGTDSANSGSLPGPVSDSAETFASANGSSIRGVRASASEPTAPAALFTRGEGGSRRAGDRFGRGRNGRRPERGPFYAALDLGTNNCRLLVAEPVRDGFRVVDSFSRIVRLGEGVAQNGRLGADAMERAIGALHICGQKLGARQMAGARLIATQACRIAENGAHFLSRVRDEVGLELEIVDRRTEARLAAEGCFSLLDPAAEGAVLFDIGGGSSEIVWLDRRKARRRGGLVRAWVSLPVGVVTLAERHGGVDVDERVFEAMVDDVRAEFHRFRARDALKDAIVGRPFHYLGTSGTVTTLAGVHLDLPRYDRRRVDGLWMEGEDIERMMTKIRRMDYDARRSNPCIGRERADLVLAGCAVFEAIRREWQCDRLRVADRGLREGILMQLMRADGHLGQRRQIRRRAPAVKKAKGSGSGLRGLHTRVKTARGRKLSSQRWLERQLNDPYVARSKSEGFRSRAAYKLAEIDDRFGLLKPGRRIVDLGAAPGGWSQVAATRVASTGEQPHVVAIDYLGMDPLPGVVVIEKDFLDADAPGLIVQALHGEKADVVLSDMAAPTTGHRATDHLRIVALCEAAADFARDVLKPGGALLAKVFRGGTENKLLADLKRDFAKVQHVKPPASRSDSPELYLLATGFQAAG